MRIFRIFSKLLSCQVPDQRQSSHMFQYFYLEFTAILLLSFPDTKLGDNESFLEDFISKGKQL